MGCSVAGKGVLPHLALGERLLLIEEAGFLKPAVSGCHALFNGVKGMRGGRGKEEKGINARAELLHRRLDRSCGHAFPEVGLLDHSRRPSSLLGRVLHFFLPNLHSKLCTGIKLL